MSRPLTIRLDDDGPVAEVVLTRGGSGATVWIDGRPHRCEMRPCGDAHELVVDGRPLRIWIAVEHDVVHVHALGRAWRLEVSDPAVRGARELDREDVAVAPMPGTVVTVGVEPGAAVAAGQPLVVIESMKMHSEVVAWRDGVVDRVYLAVGDTFDRGDALVALAPGGED